MFHFEAKKMVRGARFLIAAAAAGVALAGVARAEDITGAGSTFAAPIYTKWSEQYAAKGGAKLNYQAIGSGAGVTAILNRTVDFGATDAAVAPERLAGNHLLQFPTCVGGVVLAVNLPGVDGNNLKLSGDVVADIYMGRIKMWNDKKIAALNPGVSLPAIAVAPAYRADGSGTTNIFTTYLSAISLPFSTVIGAGNSANWKTGLGAPGNAGVAGLVANTKGGIGYVEYAYAAENKMQTPMLLNLSGKYVKPSSAAFGAAAATVDWKNAPNLAVTMSNTKGDANWPIVGPTYVVIPTNPADGARAEAVLAYFDWAFSNGQAAADALYYVTLPKSVQDIVRSKWSQVQVSGKPVYLASK